MKMKLFCLIFFISTIGYTQSPSINAANKKFELYAYADAIKMYERLAEKGYKSVDMFQKLGDSYYFQADYKNAAKWYEALINLKKPIKSEYYFRYAQSLKALNEYEKADQLMDAFANESQTDSRGKRFKLNMNYLEEIKANSGRFTIEDAGINSNFSDYGTTIYDSKLIFTSARDTGSILNTKHKWTNQSFTRLYSAEISDDSLINIQKFASKIDSRFNESTPVFTKNGMTMYFTRNNYNAGKKGKNKKNVVLLKLYRAELVGKTWSNVTELPFNSDNYSIAHPALSLDETYLYFASDMPGTHGQSDIFRVKRNEDHTFGKPENLGNQINTEGRETFPTISAENELYFASDGIPGLGGLDIFVSQINKDNSLGKPQNVGQPVNSASDDFGFCIDGATRTGYFTSNRDGGKGFDDIYKFSETRRLKCDQSIAGTITDADSHEIIANATVILQDTENLEIGRSLSDENGRFAFAASCGEFYTLRASKADYSTAEKLFGIEAKNGVTDVKLELQKLTKQIAIGSDLAKILQIERIYFDLDKWNIREDATFELEKILAILVQYPNMKIDIRSHTDSRQTAQYNIELSQKRAAATKNWLIRNGIDESRLTAKGYGESQLLNGCADGIKCSEEEHQLNRRSEFIVTAL